jgi:hypothetical protein
VLGRLWRVVTHVSESWFIGRSNFASVDEKNTKQPPFFLKIIQPPYVYVLQSATHHIFKGSDIHMDPLGVNTRPFSEHFRAWEG